MSAGPLLIGGALDFTTPPQNVRALSLAGSANRPTGRAKPRQLRVLRTPATAKSADNRNR
jgi:hypothetical protein